MTCFLIVSCKRLIVVFVYPNLDEDIVTVYVPLFNAPPVIFIEDSKPPVYPYCLTVLQNSSPLALVNVAPKGHEALLVFF